jgi:hypothetical protein
MIQFFPIYILAGVYYTLGIAAYVIIYYQNNSSSNIGDRPIRKRKGDLTYLNVTPMRMNAIRETTLDLELEYAAN